MKKIYTRYLSYLLLSATLPNISLVASEANATMQQMQEQPLRGRVLDLSGEPLIGAYVKNLRTGKTVVVDASGAFAIEGKKGDTLEISFIGMKTKRHKITATPIKIVLEDDITQLSGVVVTGYKKVNNRVFVGSAIRVKADDLPQIGSQDLSRILQGRVSGLNISDVSSSFGAAPKINIRGGGSINGNVQPLWVIDGVVYEDLVSLSADQLTSGDAVTLVGSAIAGINPSDIESVEVLKDASATSLYGARGMNGVIVVSTKAGKKGEGFHLGYGFEGSVRLRPSYNSYNLLNSQETMAIYREMERKGYFSMDESLYPRRGGIYTQMYEAIVAGKLENSSPAKADFLRGAEYQNTDWFKHIFRQSLTKNHTLSLRYGSDKLSSYASLGLLVDPGLTLADKVSRLTAYMKTSYFVTPDLTLSMGVQGNYRDQRAPGVFPRVKNPEIGAYRRDFDINPFNYSLTTSRTLSPYNKQGGYCYYRNDWAPFNILKEYDNNYLDIAVSDWRLLLEAEWKPLEDLRINALGSLRRATTSFAHTIDEGSNVVAAHRAATSQEERRDNIYLYRPIDNPLADPQVVLPEGGIYEKTNRSLVSYLARISADYTLALGRHKLDLFGFFEARQMDNRMDQFKGYGISYSRAGTVNTSPLIFDKILGEGSSYFSMGDLYDRGVTLSSSATYRYDDRYILNLVLNYEGSNVAGASSSAQWLPTWNVGGKWNIDAETFMQGLKPWVSRLALKLSYGLVAKMLPEATNSRAVYGSSIVWRRNLADRELGINIKNLENRDLTWEKMYELNAGLDLGLLDDKLYFNIDLYHRKSFDLIDLIRTSGVGGQYYKWANFGDMQTHGLDLTLRSKNVELKDFSWQSWGVFSFYKQEITRLINTPTAFDLVAGEGRGNVVGRPRSGLYSYHFTGLNDRGLPTFYLGNLPTEGIAYPNSAGANFNDAQHANSYLVFHGPTDPTISAGLGNTLRYKGWELSFFFTFQGGNKVRLTPTYDPSYRDLNVFGKEYLDRWLVRGDEVRTNVPGLPSRELTAMIGSQNMERIYNTYNYSDERVANGDFIRLKNISLSYHFPEELIKGIGLSRAVVNVQAVNPWLVYSDKRLRGQDPEFVNAGGVASPIMKMFTLGLQLGI